MLCHKQLNKPINKFILYPGKSDHMLMYGKHYFKSWDINFTNKSFKENSTALITMRLEKENEFIDLEFIHGTETFILLSKTGNQIFVFEKKVLINHLVNYRELDDKSDHSDSDSFADNIGESEDEEPPEMQTKRGRAKFSQSNLDKQRKAKGHDATIRDKIGGINFLKSEEKLTDPDFEC